MSVSIKYKGEEIASASTEVTKTIKTAGKYCEADILVENTPDGGADPVIRPLSVTENGTYTAPEGIDGYSPVNVNVQGGDFLGGIRFDAVDAQGNPTEITAKTGAELPVFFYSSVGFATTNITKIQIDGNPTTIPNSFMRNRNNLQQINLPDSITKIDIWAFGNCTHLAVNSLPSGLITLGEIAFGSPSGTATLGVTVNIAELPPTLVTIDNEAFENARGGTISHIPATVNKVGNDAFKSIDASKRMIDTTLTFDGTPTTISATAFNGNSWITDIYVPWAENAVANAPWGAVNATIHYNHVGGA